MSRRRFWEEEIESPSAIRLRMASLCDRLEQLDSEDLETALAVHEDVLAHKPEDLETWRRNAENALSPQIRRELAERRAANDAEYARHKAENEERFPSRIEKRMLKLKQESLMRLKQGGTGK